MTVHAVIYGEGAQTITTVPTGLDGEPMLLASAEARIVDLTHTEDSTDRDIVAKAAATVDSTSTTTTAACGINTANTRKVPLTSVSGILEGHSYALVDPEGHLQEVVVDHLDADTVYVESDIRFNFASGSTFRGIEVSVSFPSAEANDEDAFNQHKNCPYAVDWYFGSGPVRELIFFRRSPRVALARPHDVELLDSTIGTLNRRNDKIEKALTFAHRDFWRVIESKSIDTDTVHFGDHGRDWVTYRAAEILRRNMGNDRDDLVADEYQRSHREILNSLGGFGEVHRDRNTDRATRDAKQRAGLRIPLT